MNKGICESDFFKGVEGISYVSGPRMKNFYIESFDDKITLALLINYSKKISNNTSSELSGGFIVGEQYDADTKFIRLDKQGVSFLKELILNNRSVVSLNDSSLYSERKNSSNFLEDNLYESNSPTDEHLSSKYYLGDRNLLNFTKSQHIKPFKNQDTYSYVMRPFK